MKTLLIAIVVSSLIAGCTTIDQNVVFPEKDRRDIGKVSGIVTSNEEMFSYTSKGCFGRRSVSVTVTAPEKLSGYLIIFPDDAEGSDREPELWSLEKGNKVEMDLSRSAVYRRDFHQLQLGKVHMIYLKEEATSERS